MPPKEKYTDPKLRDQVKEEIQQSDKGGQPGQWSARKAQMMAKEYKNRGGDYNTDKSQKDESQKNLSKWGDEEWQTKEGSGEAKKADGSRKRYLPKKAWEQMSEEEKKQTDDKKQEGSKEGKQHVSNTAKAKSARKNVSNDSDDKKKASQESDDAEEEDTGSSSKENESPSPRARRKRNRDQQNDGDDDGKNKGNKKQKSNKGGEAKKAGTKTGTVGSKHDSAEAPAAQASLDRLPKRGQKAHWKALPGWVDGEVVEVVKSQKKVDGKDVKGSKDDPKIVLKSSKSGKICVHNVNNVYFD